MRKLFLFLFFKHSQEEVNHHMVASVYGEEAAKELHHNGVYYPKMDYFWSEN